MSFTNFDQVTAEAYAYYQQNFLDFDTSDRSDDKVDAFRHAYASAVFTMEWNSGVANTLGLAYEFEGLGRGFLDGQTYDQMEPSFNMDLYNNSIGRQIGASNSTKQEIADSIVASINNNELIIIDESINTDVSYNLIPDEAVFIELIGLVNDYGTALWSIEAYRDKLMDLAEEVSKIISDQQSQNGTPLTETEGGIYEMNSETSVISEDGTYSYQKAVTGLSVVNGFVNFSDESLASIVMNGSSDMSEMRNEAFFILRDRALADGTLNIDGDGTRSYTLNSGISLDVVETGDPTQHVEMMFSSSTSIRPMGVTTVYEGAFQQQVTEVLSGQDNSAVVTITTSSEILNQAFTGGAITLNYPEEFVFSDVGGHIGNIVGQHMADNTYQDILYAAALKTMGQNVGAVVDLLAEGTAVLDAAVAGLVTGANTNEAITQLQSHPDVFDGFLSNLQTKIVGTIGSYIASEVVDLIEIDGIGGEIFEVAAGTVTTGFVSGAVDLLFNDLAGNVYGSLLANDSVNFSTKLADIGDFNAQNLPSDVTTVGDYVQYQVANAIGGYVGNRVAGEVIEAESEIAAIFGAVGSAVAVGMTTGAILSGSTFSTIGASLGSVVPGLGTAIGAFVGTVIGTAFGNLFGDDDLPTAWARLQYDPNDKDFFVAGNWGSDGGDVNLARTMGQQVIEGINDILEASHGKLRSGAEAPLVQVGYEGNEFLVSVNGGGVQTFGTTAGAVNYAAFAIMKDFDLVGGHAVVMRAWHNSDATNIYEWLEDIQVAEAFQNYLLDPASILALMMSDPESDLALSWAAILKRAGELELHLPHEKDLDGGWGEVLLAQDIDPDFIPAIEGDSLTITNPITGEETVLHHIIGPGYEIVRIEGTDGDDTIQVVVDGPSISYVNGLEGDDIIEGSDQVDILVGGAGEDTINGNDGNDWLHGGSGDDTLDGGAGEDLVVGGENNDYLLGNTGSDQIYGNGGDDFLFGNEGKDFLYGGLGNDTLDGGTGEEDYVYGGEGDDTFIVYDRDNLWGGQGDDHFILNQDSSALIYIGRDEGHDVIDVSDGSNHLIFDHTIGMFELLYETIGNDVKIRVLGEDQSITLKNYFASGNEITTGTAGNYHRIDNLGGEKTTISILADQQSFLLSDMTESYNLFTDSDLATWESSQVQSDWDGNSSASSTDGTTGDGFFHSSPSDSDLLDPVIYTSGDDNVIYTHADEGTHNFHFGGAGDDTIVSSAPDYDRRSFKIYGDSGNDYLAGSGNGDYIIGGLGLDTIYGLNGNDALYGGYDNDRIYGGDGTDRISGGFGDDELSGGNHDDEIYGGLGNDIISGGDGVDRIKGEDGYDVIDAGRGNDTAYGGLGNDSIYGDEGSDTLNGGQGDDTIEGADGDDWISGDEGDDVVSGGRGNDIINGGDGNDTAIYDGSFLNYKINTDSNENVLIQDIVGGEGIDRLLNVEKIQFTDGYYEGGSITADGGEVYSLSEVTDAMDNDIFLGKSHSFLYNSDTSLSRHGLFNQSTVDALPVLNGNTVSPTGTLTSSSEYNSGYASWKALDGSTSAYSWYSQSHTDSEWLAFSFNEAKIINKYILAGNSVSNRTDASPQDWTIEASNDGLNWVVLDTVTGETDWSPSEQRTFGFLNSTAYNDYRIMITENNGRDYFAIGEFDLIEASQESVHNPFILGDVELDSTAADQIESMELRLSGHHVSIAEEILSVTAPSHITSDYSEDVGTGDYVLSLTGLASIADYQDVLNNISYQNTAINPVDGMRNVAVTITDSDSNESTYNVDVLVGSDSSAQSLPDINYIGKMSGASFGLEEDGSLNTSEVDALPVLNGGNTSSIGTLSSSGHYNSTVPTWRVLDGSTDGTPWYSQSNIGTAWISFSFDEAKVINKYLLAGNSTSNRVDASPKDWIIEGSNDGSTWALLDTVTDEENWTPSETRYFDFTNGTAYTDYRITMTATNGRDYFALTEIDLIEAIETQPVSTELSILSDIALDPNIDRLLSKIVVRLEKDTPSIVDEVLFANVQDDVSAIYMEQDDYYVLELSGRNTIDVYEDILHSVTYKNSVDELTGDRTVEVIAFDLEGNISQSFNRILDLYEQEVVGTSMDDILTSAEGDHALYGEAGNDQLFGGSDDDLLYGGDGVDTLTGGAGVDIFMFDSATALNDVDVIADYSLAENDVIDLSDVLSGYDEVADTITDFMGFTFDGTHSQLQVDIDGTDITNSMTTIATLNNVDLSGEDIQTLINNGSVVV